MSTDTGWPDLPSHCTTGVMSDGRVFFINDDTETTSWCHPETGDPVQTGQGGSSGLPCGWESGYTPEGSEFYIK
ncbi:hypothetical protein FKM82_019650 [Ascaphus truei]